MLSKIDGKLLEKISIQSLECDKVDVLIYSNKFNETKDKILDMGIGETIELPFVSCIAAKVDLGCLFKLANLESVKFIGSDIQVLSQIYKSKKFINANVLDSYNTGDYTHTCVVIDTGVYPHIDFCLGRNRVVKFVDLINQSKVMYDDNGHGTLICGILSANSITDKYNGIDNKSDIIVIKALDNAGETSSVKILEAMQWVLDNKQKFNIRVVCMSFGSVLQDKNDPLIFGAEVLWDNGIVVVSAGGNNGPELSTIMSPGGSRKIITVGALDDINSGEIKVANFSSRGPVFSYYKPDMLLPGVDIIGTNVFSLNKKFYTKMSGTSVSTPMVAGVASRLIRINPKYTPDQIKYMLINSCIEITGDRNAEGYGRLDLSKLILI